jgi:hypothetical protein
MSSKKQYMLVIAEMVSFISEGFCKLLSLLKYVECTDCTAGVDCLMEVDWGGGGGFAAPFMPLLMLFN